jgi:hypothetical protein
MSPAVTTPGPFLLRLFRVFRGRRCACGGDVLEVQQDFDHVLLQAFDRGVLVQHAVDFDLGNRR